MYIVLDLYLEFNKIYLEARRQPHRPLPSLVLVDGKKCNMILAKDFLYFLFMCIYMYVFIFLPSTLLYFHASNTAAGDAIDEHNGP